jgi:hypothetical protein
LKACPCGLGYADIVYRILSFTGSSVFIYILCMGNGDVAGCIFDYFCCFRLQGKGSKSKSHCVVIFISETLGLLDKEKTVLKGMSGRKIKT